MTRRNLDVGCGRNEVAGAIGIDYFAEDSSKVTCSSGHFRVVSRDLGFSSSPVNWLPRMTARWRPRRYEKYLAFLLPEKNIRVELEIKK